MKLFAKAFVSVCVCVQENIPIDEVFENLRCTREGLTNEAAEERLAIFGHNKLEEKKVLILYWNSCSSIFGFFWVVSVLAFYPYNSLELFALYN